MRKLNRTWKTLWLAAAFTVTPLWSQNAGEVAEEEVFELSPFTVSTSQDVGYLSTNSTSGTSLNTPIKDLPMSSQVPKAFAFLRPILLNP